MGTIATRMTLAAAGLLALAAWHVVPGGVDAMRHLAAQDDPAALVELGLDKRFSPAIAAREMELALTANDPELAQSFLELADERGAPVDPALRRRVEIATAATATATHAVARFIDGFVVGDPNDLASLAGTVTGDLFVYGDIRDAVRETGNLIRGEKADELILGLACVGLAVTAGTYASLGAGAPARAGLSVVKAAGKAGRLSARLTHALIGPLRAAVDTATLRKVLGPSALVSPAFAIRGAREAVKIEKAAGALRVLGDVGQIQAKAGTRAALDGLKFTDTPKDVARLATVASTKGGKTRAVLKTLGRGAIMLTIGLFQLTSWVFWALLTVIGLVASLKRLTERFALRFIHWRKHARARRLLATALPA